MAYCRFLAYLTALVLSSCPVYALGAEKDRCLSNAQAHEAIVREHLLDSFSAMRRGTFDAEAEALNGHLCRDKDGYIYEITLLRRDGHVVRVTLDAADGTVLNEGPRGR